MTSRKRRALAGLDLEIKQHRRKLPANTSPAGYLQRRRAEPPIANSATLRS